MTTTCRVRLCYQLRFDATNYLGCMDFAYFACVEIWKVCSYFPKTIWDCMDIVDYLDYAGYVMLIVMFDVVVLYSLDD